MTDKQQTATENFDDLRQAVATTDALIAATHDLYASTPRGPDVDAQREDRISHLLVASCNAAESAIIAVDRFHSSMCDAGVPGWSPS